MVVALFSAGGINTHRWVILDVRSGVCVFLSLLLRLFLLNNSLRGETLHRHGGVPSPVTSDSSSTWILGFPLSSPRVRIHPQQCKATLWCEAGPGSTEQVQSLFASLWQGWYTLFTSPGRFIYCHKLCISSYFVKGLFAHLISLTSRILPWTFMSEMQVDIFVSYHISIYWVIINSQATSFYWLQFAMDSCYLL